MSDQAPIVDTHVHLDDPAFDEDRDEVVSAARAAGIRRFINIGYTPEGWEASRALHERHPDIDFALGLHPQQADRFTQGVAGALRAAVRELRPVAVGETGFDFARTGPSRGQQEHAFHAQIEIAAEAGLPVIIHQRQATDEILEVLDRFPGATSFVLHSFDGTPRLTEWAIERGCFVGIGGLATRRAAAPLRELLATIPLSQLLLETDAPYLTPPSLASRRNTPANLRTVVKILAPLWQLSAEDLCRATTANAIRVFKFTGDSQTGMAVECPTAAPITHSGGTSY